MSGKLFGKILKALGDLPDLRLKRILLMCRADGAGKKLELGSENLKKIRNAMFGYVGLLKAGQEVVKNLIPEMLLL